MVRILVCDPLHPEGIGLMEKSGMEVVNKSGISHEELLREIGLYDAIIVRSRTKITRDVINRADRLKLIVRAGVGLDNIDVEAARERGITVVNTPQAPTNAVAELVIGLMLTLARRIPYCDSEMKKGNWVKSRILGIELKGRTLGVVGFGRIGRLLADKALALGMKVLAYDVVPIPEEYKEKGIMVADSVESVFERSDFVSIHVPLTKDTYHLVNENLLRRMKPTAYLINTSRGGVVDSEALKKALRKGWIAGAALDVFEKEPPGKDELVLMDEVVATPHIGAQTEEAQRNASIMAAEEIVKFFRGRR